MSNFVDTQIKAQDTEMRRDFKKEASELHLIPHADLLRIATAQSPHLVPFLLVTPVKASDERDPYRRIAENIEHVKIDVLGEQTFIAAHEQRQGKKLRESFLFDGTNGDMFGISDLPPVSTRRFLRLIHNVFDAVDSLHNIYSLSPNGELQHDSLIHGDIGIHNILLYRHARNGDLLIWLCDYDMVQRTGTTQLSTVPWGSAEVVPPEMHHGRKDAVQMGVRIDQRSDIFCLGWAVFDMMMYRTPEEVCDVYSRKAIDACKDESLWEQFRDRFSPQLERVLRKATKYDQTERYKSVEDFWHDYYEAWSNTYNRHVLMEEFSSERAKKRILGKVSSKTSS